jgi:pimeloyl-ACP methyl ester carboxylesterase
MIRKSTLLACVLALTGLETTSAQVADRPFVSTATDAYAAPEEAYVAIRPMIADMQRVVTPDGIQTLERVELGGIEQWIAVRGTDIDNPILVYVHGGPGAIELGRSWPWQRAVEDYFTVVQWDQRGAGKTARLNGVEATRPTLTRARMADDLVELIDLLQARYGDRKLVVLGHSWGNVIALDAAMKRPDAIAAYVGLSPLLSWEANERAGYERLLEIARERGDAAALAELEAMAPYPGDGALTSERLAAQRAWVQRYGGLAAYRDFFLKAARLSPDYDLTDRQAIDAGGLASVETLLPELAQVDFSVLDHTSFPVLMFVGRHDITTPPEVTEAWLNALDAPSKRLVWFEHSAHLAPHEEPGRFLMALVEHVRPLAEPDR